MLSPLLSQSRLVVIRKSALVSSFSPATATTSCCCRTTLRGRRLFAASASPPPAAVSGDATPVVEAAGESHFLLILGKPGGGKGTISGKILRDFPKFHHVSTGDLLRQNVRQETPLGKQAAQYMESGRLVPDELMIELVIDDATPFLEQGKSLLLDGFPRNVEQAKALDQAAHVDYIINLNVPTETIVERIADRWIHPASGRIYSYAYRPPTTPGLDDITHEPLVQREDDKPEAVRTRLTAYDKVTAPLVEWYQSRHRTIKTFTGTESDVIYPQVKAWLEEQNFS